jgi:glycosyltransferase involved in cell wall biosynthesis
MDDITVTTPLRKVLFVDQPFMGCDTSRCARSSFLWDIISTAFDADLLLLKTNEYLEKPVPVHSGFDKLYSLSLNSSSPIYPDSYHVLGAGQSERFAGILDSKRYELIVFAGLSCLALVRIARKILPNCTLVTDIDRIFLPGLEADWKAHKSFETLPKLWSFAKQSLWDKILLKPESKYFFANPSDAIALQKTSRLRAENLLIVPMPIDNLPEAPQPNPELGTQTYILFWGNPLDHNNLEAGKLLVSELYPRISKKLVEKNIGIVLCGPRELRTICGGRIQFTETLDYQSNQINETDGEQTNNLLPSIDTLISQALFVLLPLFAPDSENRIVRSALHGKAVVCTAVAAENLQLPETCLVSAENIDALATKVTRLLQYPKEIDASASALHGYCIDTYNRETISANILSQINTWMES